MLILHQRGEGIEYIRRAQASYFSFFEEKNLKIIQGRGEFCIQEVGAIEYMGEIKANPPHLKQSLYPTKSSEGC